MRRVAALAAALLVLVLGACSDDGDDATASTTTTTAVDVTTASSTTTAPAAEGPLRIVVTNDDGVAAEGIDAVVVALEELDDVEVSVVAPREQRSGSGGTFKEGPLETQEAETASGHEAIAVDGYPADTLRVAIDELELDPHLVVSGINEGQNVGGLVDISGTVGAARAAVARGIPALALSSGTPGYDYDAAVPILVEWVTENRADLLAGEAEVEVASVNIPSCAAGEVRGLVEVPVGTGTPIEPQDCTSTLEDPVDDVEAFAHGYAALSIVPDEPATPPQPGE